MPAEIDSLLSLGRSLSNAAVEQIARAAFLDLAGAPLCEIARRMGDVRDAIDGLHTLSPADLKLLERALLALATR